MIEHEIIKPLSLLWWQATLVIVGLITLIIYLGKRLSKTGLERLAKVIGIILIGRSIFFHPYVASLGLWSIQDSLPLHLCGLSSIMSGLILFYRKQWLYELLYFWGIPGAFHSLLTPEFTHGTQGLLFFDYYLSHGGILLSALFTTRCLGFQPRRGSWWRIFFWSQFLIPGVGLINWMAGANYMYISSPPIVNNPFVIGQFPYHLIGFEIAALIHFFAVYIPFGFKYSREEKAKEPEIIA